VVALASKRSEGVRLPFGEGELVVEEMTESSFEGVDIALFSAGASVSKRFREAVVDSGCVMIDNSSAFRMDDDVPLVVPEVNPDDLRHMPASSRTPTVRRSSWSLHSSRCTIWRS
jgi:aspartate-semialdehyde dehydrogenase